jgi:hypothetical protein
MDVDDRRGIAFDFVILVEKGPCHQGWNESDFYALHLF